MTSKAEINELSHLLLKALEEELGGPTKGAAVHGRYIGAQKHEDRKADEQSRLEFWGHQVPRHRELAKMTRVFETARGPVALSELSLEDQWKVWLGVWKASSVYDIKSIAMIWMTGPKLREIRRKKVSDLFKLASEIDNWAHSDSLSSVLAEVLEADTSHLPQYKKWNQSKNPWLRRQSLVGLYCYARQRKKHLPARVALGLVEPLLTDKHFYVQRGVGWVLREIDRVDSELQRKFVRQNLMKISGVAWFATSELYPATLKKELVSLRKQGRKRPVSRAKRK